MLKRIGDTIVKTAVKSIIGIGAGTAVSFLVTLCPWLAPVFVIVGSALTIFYVFSLVEQIGRIVRLEGEAEKVAWGEFAEDLISTLAAGAISSVTCVKIKNFFAGKNSKPATIIESGKTSIPNKGFSSFNDLKKYLGSPGAGNAWHHIVEQFQISKSGFSSNEVNNVNNIIAIPHGKGTVHAKITGYYSSVPSSGFTNGLTVRQWLSGQSFQQQFDFGMNILKQYGDVIKTSKGWQFIPFD